MKTAGTSGTTTSLWMATETMPEFGSLDKDITVDVCVIGGGIAGLTSAYLLSKEGLDVALIDDGPLASGETSRTTAHLTNVLDDTFTKLEFLFGEDNSKLAAKSHAVAIDKIEEIINKLHIECDFARVNGYLFKAPNYTDDDLLKEMEAAQRAGLKVTSLKNAPLPNVDTGLCLKYENQAQFHVLKYLKKLTEVMADTVKIYCNTKAVEIKDGEQPYVKVESGLTIKAKQIIVATNSPVNDIVTMHTKQAAYRSYVIGAKIAKGYVEKALYWDTLENYHYVRTQPFDNEHEILIIGGEDNKTGQGEALNQFDNLRSWANAHFHEIQEFLFEWSGQVMEPVDSLAFLGKNPGDENIYIITGDSGHGMTHATLGAMIITDLIENRKNPYSDLYSPARITLKSADSFIKENANVVAKYTELFTKSDVDNISEIAAGSGAVISKKLSKIAVYKDGGNKPHFMSAICPHLGCVVGWNEIEKSWDCPCHGSRFDCTGHMINGPATSDLNPAEV